MEIYIVALLLVIAVSEIYRTYLGMKPRSKKEHFKGKLHATRSMIWDLQFKVFKTREVREGIRQEYDYLQSQLQNINLKIEAGPGDGDVGEFNRLADQKELMERDAARFLAQMKHLDLEVEGERPSKDNPEGHEGITMQIDSLRELEIMLKDWIKEV